MPDAKITALTAISVIDPAVDPLPIVDVSDTAMAASGTTKKITINQLLGASGTATLASATITGDLTVDTSTLKVDSTNNRVGIVTASPADFLEVVGSGANGIRVSRSGQPTQFATLSAGATGPTLNASSAIGELSFGIAGTSAVAMTLNSTGLGVGTTPSYKVHVFGASPALTIQDSTSAAGGVGGTINFIAYTSGTSGANIEAQIKGVKSSASSAGELLFFTSDSSGNSQQRFMVDGTGSLVLGAAAVATTATDGFLYIPGCAGTPTGTPTAKTGRVPLVVDTTNNKLYFYSGGAWVAAN